MKLERQRDTATDGWRYVTTIAGEQYTVRNHSGWWSVASVALRRTCPAGVVTFRTLADARRWLTNLEEHEDRVHPLRASTSGDEAASYWPAVATFSASNEQSRASRIERSHTDSRKRR
jgi:hypothetical protein